jgi:hypothetical protein
MATMRNRVDFCGGSDVFICFESSLGVNEVRSEKSVDQSGFSKASLPYNEAVESPQQDATRVATDRRPLR